MSKAGYNVACADINLKEAKETLKIILDFIVNGISIEMDVTKSSDIVHLMNTVNKFIS